MKQKNNHKFWIYKPIKNRDDNLSALSVDASKNKLIVITLLVNWRIDDNYDKKAKAISLEINEGRISKDVQIAKNVFVALIEKTT
jgi:type I restriction-modification system DNA methylase subunit